MGKVLGMDSWLESTLDQKRKRIEDETPDKEALSQAIQSRIALAKLKKAKTFSTLSWDPSTGHLTMEIAKPTKEARVEDLTIADFEIQFINLGKFQHEMKVDLWKATTKVSEEELEELKLSKVKLKAKIHELNSFIW